MAWVLAALGVGVGRAVKDKVEDRCGPGQVMHYLVQEGLQVIPLQNGLVTSSRIIPCLKPGKESHPNFHTPPGDTPIETGLPAEASGAGVGGRCEGLGDAVGTSLWRSLRTEF